MMATRLLPDYLIADVRTTLLKVLDPLLLSKRLEIHGWELGTFQWLGVLSVHG